MIRTETMEMEDTLVREIREPVARFLRRMLGAERADDAISETLLAVLAGSRRWGLRRPVSFALRVAWRKGTDALRRGRRRGEDLPEEELPDHVDAFRAAELREWLEAGLRRLDPDERALLHLFHEQGLDYRAIGRIVRRPAGTVGRQLAEARSRLGRELERIGGGERVPLVLALLAPAQMSTAVTAASTVSMLALISGGLLMKRMAIVVAVVLALAGVTAWFARDRTRAPVEEAGLGAGVAPPARPSGEPPSGSAPEGEVVSSVGYTGEPSPAGEDATAITGRVVDFAGRRVPRARVRAVPRTGASLFDLGPSDAGAVAADGEGRFRVATRRGALVALVAESPVSGTGTLDRVAPDAADVVIALPPAMRIEGEVVSVEGAPVARPSIELRHLQGSARVHESVRGDDQGRFVLDGAPDPAEALLEQSMLRVEAEGFAPRSFWLAGQQQGEFQVEGGTIRARVVLSRGGVVTGTVRLERQGSTVAGAEVVLWSTEGFGGMQRPRGFRVRNPFGSRILARTRSDGNGRYRFDHVPCDEAGIGILPTARTFVNGRPKSGGVVAYLPGHAPGGAELGAPAEAGEVQVLNIDLPPAATVLGRVVDEAGQPVAGLRVFATPGNAERAGLQQGPRHGLVNGESGHLGGCVVTDADGRFRHDFAPCPEAGKGSVRVQVCGCDLGLPSVERDAQVVPGGISEVGEITMAVGGAFEVQGTVRDATGRAVVGAVIFGSTGTAAATDERGCFGIVARPDRHRSPPMASLQVSARGFAPVSASIRPDGKPLDIRLERGLRLAGRVEDAGGRPAAGVLLRINVAQDDPMPQPVMDVVTSVARSDASGGFVFEDLPAQSWRIHVPGTRPGSSRAEKTVARSGQEDVVIRLSADESSGARFEVRVVDAADGAPIVASSARAVLDDGSRTIGSRTVGPGLFSFASVPSGTWTLRVVAPGYADCETPVTLADGRPASGPFEVRIGDGARIDGRIEIAGGGEVPAGLEVAAQRAGGGPERVTAQSRADGSFRIAGLAPGRWILEARGGKGERAFATAEPPELGLESGQRVAATVRVVPAAAVSLTVRYAIGGAPPSSRTLTGRNGQATVQRMILVVKDAGGRTWMHQKLSGAEVGPVGPMGSGLLLVPGTYEASVLLDGAPVWSGPLTAPGQAELVLPVPAEDPSAK